MAGKAVLAALDRYRSAAADGTLEDLARPGAELCAWCPFAGVALFKTVHRVRLLAAHHSTIGGAFEGGAAPYTRRARL